MTVEELNLRASAGLLAIGITSTTTFVSGMHEIVPIRSTIEIGFPWRRSERLFEYQGTQVIAPGSNLLAEPAGHLQAHHLRTLILEELALTFSMETRFR